MKIHIQILYPCLRLPFFNKLLMSTMGNKTECAELTAENVYQLYLFPKVIMGVCSPLGFFVEKEFPVQQQV